MRRLVLLSILAAALFVGCGAEPFGIGTPVVGSPTVPGASVIWRTPGFVGIGRPDADSASVFVMDRGANVRAFKRSTGQSLWETKLPGIGPFSEVAIAGDVLVASSGAVFGLDPRNGTILWTYNNADGPGELPITTSDVSVFPSIYNGPGMMVALDAKSGTERWRRSVFPQDSVIAPGEFIRISGSAFDNGKVYVSFTLFPIDRRPKRGGIAAFSEFTGTRLWSRLLPVTDVAKATFASQPAARGDLVVVSSEDGNAYALNSIDGTIRWIAPPLVPPASSNLPVPALDDRPVGTDGIFVAVGSGVGYLEGFDARSGKKLWQIDVGQGGIMNLLPFAGQKIITHHLNGALAGVDALSGKISWLHYPLTPERFFQPRVRGDTIFATGTDGLWSIKSR